MAVIKGMYVGSTKYDFEAQLPAVNDGALTIQKNGTTIGTFTANDADNVNVNVVVPTKTSDITNDSGFITSSYHDSTKLDATKCTYQTTEPSSAITDGGVHIVYLSSEPSTKYDGYIYLIAES